MWYCFSFHNSNPLSKKKKQQRGEEWGWKCCFACVIRCICLCQHTHCILQPFTWLCRYFPCSSRQYWTLLRAFVLLLLPLTALIVCSVSLCPLWIHLRFVLILTELLGGQRSMTWDPPPAVSVSWPAGAWCQQKQNAFILCIDECSRGEVLAVLFKYIFWLTEYTLKNGQQRL